MSEEWRIIEGFPSYAVSNAGHVKRVAAGRYRVTDKLLGTRPGSNGYCAAEN
jgi:hypothetical protein